MITPVRVGVAWQGEGVRIQNAAAPHTEPEEPWGKQVEE